jgi:hypothetical protein
MSAIKAAIEELMAEIQVRQDAVDSLRKVRPLALPPNVSEYIISTARIEGKETKWTKGTKGASKTKPDGTKSSGETLRIAGIVSKLSEPIKTMQIQEAAKVDCKKASNFVTQSKMKGWLKPTGKTGEYVRTAKFPTARPTHEVLPPAGHKAPGRTRAIVEAELKRACEERDAHRSASRAAMQEIAQRRVDGLEEELEALQ